MELWRHKIALDFNVFFLNGGGGLWPPPPPPGAIVEKYIEIESVGRSRELKNVILCLQNSMGFKINPHGMLQGSLNSSRGQRPRPARYALDH